MHIKNRKGQSTVEYVLLVTAVIAVMVAFATSKSTGLQGQLNSSLTNVVGDLGNMANTLADSHSATTANYVAPPLNYVVTN